jgi:hypothetical protein
MADSGAGAGGLQVGKLFATIGLDSTKLNATLGTIQRDLAQTGRAFVGLGRAQIGVSGIQKLQAEAKVLERQAVALRLKMVQAVGDSAAYEKAEKDLQGVETRIRDIEKVAADAKKPVTELSQKLEAVGEKGVWLTTHVTAPILAIGAGLLGAAQHAGKYAEDMVSASAATGVNVEKLEEMKYAAGTVGVEFESVTQTMLMLQRKLLGMEEDTGNAAKVMKDRLHMSVEDINGHLRSMGDLFPAAMSRLREFTNESERNSVAAQIFGRSYGQLMRLLSMGNDEYDALIAHAKEMGAIGDTEGAEKFAKAWNQTKLDLDALVRQLGTVVIPMLTALEPVCQKIIGKLKDSVDWVKKLDPATNQLVAIVAALFAILGPGLTILSKIPGVTMAIFAGLIKIIASGKEIAEMVATFGLGETLAALVTPIGLVITSLVALTAVIYGVSKAVEYYNTSQRRGVESALAVNESQKKTAEQAQKLISEYDELNKKTNKTTEENIKLQQILLQIKELSPDLIDGHKLRADAADKETESIKKLNAEYTRLAIAKMELDLKDAEKAKDAAKDDYDYAKRVRNKGALEFIPGMKAHHQQFADDAEKGYLDAAMKVSELQTSLRDFKNPGAKKARAGGYSDLDTADAQAARKQVLEAEKHFGDGWLKLKAEEEEALIGVKAKSKQAAAIKSYYQELRAELVDETNTTARVLGDQLSVLQAKLGRHKYAIGKAEADEAFRVSMDEVHKLEAERDYSGDHSLDREIAAKKKIAQATKSLAYQAIADDQRRDLAADRIASERAKATRESVDGDIDKGYRDSGLAAYHEAQNRIKEAARQGLPVQGMVDQANADLAKSKADADEALYNLRQEATKVVQETRVITLRAHGDRFGAETAQIQNELTNAIEDATHKWEKNHGFDKTSSIALANAKAEAAQKEVDLQEKLANLQTLSKFAERDQVDAQLAGQNVESAKIKLAERQLTLAQEKLRIDKESHLVSSEELADDSLRVEQAKLAVRDARLDAQAKRNASTGAGEDANVLQLKLDGRSLQAAIIEIVDRFQQKMRDLDIAAAHGDDVSNERRKAYLQEQVDLKDLNKPKWIDHLDAWKETMTAGFGGGRVDYPRQTVEEIKGLRSDIGRFTEAINNTRRFAQPIPSDYLG